MRGGSGPRVSISAPTTTGSLRGRPDGRSSDSCSRTRMTDCLVVVVRYFGGTKLGVPGLIAAYRESAAAAIGAARIVERTVDRTVRVDFPYIVLNNIMRVVKEQQPKIVSQEFDNLCTMVFAIRESRAAELIEKLKKPGAPSPKSNKWHTKNPSISKVRGCTTSRISRWRSRTKSWSSSRACRARENRRWPSTRSSPKGSAAMSRASRPMRASSSGRSTKPDVDIITGIAPAIAIEQKVNTRNPRSTVGTTTEIYDYLKAALRPHRAHFFARVGAGGALLQRGRRGGLHPAAGRGRPRRDRSAAHAGQGAGDHRETHAAALRRPDARLDERAKRGSSRISCPRSTKRPAEGSSWS